MKKLSIIIILLTIFIIPVFAEDDDELSRIVFNWNVGNLGYGGNIPFSKPLAEEVVFSLVHVGIEDRYTNMGIEFCPFLFYHGWKLPEGEYYGENDGYISLLNLKVYWNILDLSGFFIGPFASVNYFFLDEDFMMDKFIFTAGFHIGWKINFKNVNYNIIMGELGYRNGLDGSNRYHVGVKIDILSLFLIYLATSAVSHWWWY
ncbi:MAG: hypothetical protein LBU88_02495 [Treponema sp.]|jgi:hypothetical protein|nr:hypothetical protein [Treponema sp.]